MFKGAEALCLGAHLFLTLGWLFRRGFCVLQRGLEDTLAFPDGYQLIRFNAVKSLDQAVRPVDLEVGMDAVPQAEV